MSKQSDQPLDLEPDYDQSIEFARQLKPNVPVTLVAIKEGVKTEAHTYEPSELEEAKAWICGLNGDKYNIYFQVNEANGESRNKKAKKADIASASLLHVDIDDLGEDVLNKIASFEPSPTTILMSGGGYQAFWWLDGKCTDLEQIEAINKSIARELGGDNCHNIDRIMRMPGTINWPSAKKRKAGRAPVVARLLPEHTNPSRQYGLSVFQRLVLLSNAFPVGPAATKPDELPIVKLEDIRENLGERFAHLVEIGDDPEAPRGSASQRFQSRSEVVFAVASIAARQGVSREQIAGLLLNPDYKISESVLEKPNPEDYAWRQADKAAGLASNEWPDVSRSGKPLPTFPNALVGLYRMGITFEYDAFKNRKRVGGHQLNDFQGDLTDDAAAMLRKRFLETHKFDPFKGNILDAVQVLCLEHTYHPIRDYLDGVIWDKTPRLETWLSDYLGAPDTVLNRRIGKMMLVAAVRRVRRPGCKFDFMIVFEGSQGTGKSTAVAILAGEGNFSDQHLIGLDDKAQMEALEGVWLFEVAELDGMSRADISKIKAFITRTEDRARPAYARFKESWHRQSILIGTTNERFYLKDATGNRRFLPVKTAVIDLDSLANDRDQIWAEAAKLEAEGFSIHLPKEFWEAAAGEQAERMQENPWISILETVNGAVIKGGIERVGTETLFGEDNLDIKPVQRKPYHPKDLAEVMNALGWDGPKKLRIIPGANPVRGYERPTDEADDIDM